MKALLYAEAQKLRATRSSMAVAATGAAYGALAVAAVALAPDERPAIDQDTILQIIRGVADLSVPAAVVLALTGTAGEHRHGTIVPTLLISPRRHQVVKAKLAWHALLAAVIAMVGSLLALGAGTAYLASQDARRGAPGTAILLTITGVMAVTIAYAASAAALGLIVRNQTTVITGALVWMLAIENIVPLLLHAPGLRRWLLDGSADRLLHLVHPDPAMHSAWLALLTFVAVAAGLALTATVRFDRSDVP